MTEQRHRIKRQVVEIRISRASQSDDLYSKLGRIYRQRMVPIINRACTRLSAPDRLHRIECLELDLGCVDARHLEKDLVEKLSRMLPEALAEHIHSGKETGNRTCEGGKNKQSQIELLAVFARTGALPWWTDSKDPDLLNTVINDLLRNSPRSLIRCIQDLARNERCMKRIILHCNDETLAAMLGLVTADLETEPIGFFRELGNAIERANLTSGKTRKEIDIKIWQGIMQTVCQSKHPFKDMVQYRKSVLMGIAVEMGVRYAAMLTALHGWLQRRAKHARAGINGELMRSIALLSEELSSDTAPEQMVLRSEKKTHQALADAMGRLKGRSDGTCRLIEWLYPITEYLPQTMSARFMGLLQTSLDRKPGEKATDEMLAFLQSAIEQNLLPRSVLRRLFMELRQREGMGLSPGELTGLEKRLRNAILKKEKFLRGQDEGSPDLRFGESDDLYIDNSGLVILWPFLDRFFSRLNLMHAKRFISDSAMHRAVGLLQYLAAAHRFGPEHQLPLNKVLCGMALAEVFVFTEPVSDAEVHECVQMLEAVIKHAPILKQMSVSGFRGSFLLRKGILGTRDGAWLLRVERESYDVVLDRFPWDIGWVKLPWMEAPLRVEW